jgi:hypothetical protein
MQRVEETVPQNRGDALRLSLICSSGESEYVAGLHSGTEAGALVGPPAQVLAGECVDPCTSLAAGAAAQASHMRVS